MGRNETHHAKERKLDKTLPVEVVQEGREEIARLDGKPLEASDFFNMLVGEKVVGKSDELEMFRCYVCGKFKSTTELNQIAIRDLLFKKDVCTQCKDQMMGNKSELIVEVPKKEEAK